MPKPQELSQLERVAQRAKQNIPEHKANTPRVEIYKLRGRIGEELAQDEIGGVNLNDLTGKSNFPNYDIVSKENISSVKVMGLTEEGKPRYSGYNKYFSDIVNPDSKSNQRAAKDMLSAIEKNPEMSEHLPAEIAEAGTQGEMAHALADKSILQIPYDQVDSVKENIYNRVTKSPSDYGLSNNLSPTDLEPSARELVDSCIQPIANGQYSSHEMGKAAENVYVQGYLVENTPPVSSGTVKDGQNNQPSPSSVSKNEGEDENYDYSYGY